MGRRDFRRGWGRSAVALVAAVSLSGGCGAGGQVETSSGGPASDPAAASSGTPGTGSQRYAATGRVLMPDGGPAEQVLVSAVSMNDPPIPVPELAVLTDPRGRWSWPGLRPGRYEFRATTKAGSGQVRVTVTAGATATADITLRP